MDNEPRTWLEWWSDWWFVVLVFFFLSLAVLSDFQCEIRVIQDGQEIEQQEVDRD